MPDLLLLNCAVSTRFHPCKNHQSVVVELHFPKLAVPQTRDDDGAVVALFSFESHSPLRIPRSPWCNTKQYPLPPCASSRSRVSVNNRTAARLLAYQQRYPDGSRWVNRGWLTILRARHLRLVARPANRCRSAFRKPSEGERSWKTQKRPHPFPEIAFYNCVESLAERACLSSPELKPSVMDRLEAGQSDKDFVWAVETVVELQAEELFRHIVSFLLVEQYRTPRRTESVPFMVGGRDQRQM